MRLSGAPALGMALGMALAILSAPAAHARIENVYVCDQITVESEQVADASPSTPLDRLGVRRAQELAMSGGRQPGPLAVAVLDSGVSLAREMIPVLEERPFTTEIADYHGTAVAGLIAAKPRPDGKLVGIAPDVRIVDVRVFEESAEGEAAVSTDRVVAGLNWVADRADDLGIRVVNVSLSVSPTDALAAAVRRVWKADIVIVAASGNRPLSDADPLWARFGEGGVDVGPGEDAAGAVYPAAYPHVVAVNATAGGYPGAVDLKESVLANTDTDVAAPTYDGVSVALNGSNCRIQQIATSFAAAEVSGVVALLRTRFPGERAPQIVARLVHTADGTVDDPTPFQGAGVVQPVEALTRPMHPDLRGAVAGTTPVADGSVRATAPDPVRDELEPTRRAAVWWGLLGGGALILALMLRPVLSRRRE